MDRSHSFRPALQELSSRIAPAVFLWRAGLNALWSSDNWLKQNVRTGAFLPTTDYPGENGDDDDVRFDGGNYNVAGLLGIGGLTYVGNRDCVVDVPVTVGSLKVSRDSDGNYYTKTIRLDSDLTIKQPTGGSQESRMESGSISGGHLRVDAGTFVWFGGLLDSDTVHVARGAEVNVHAVGFLFGAAQTTMKNTIFDVAGLLNWTGGDVTVLGPNTKSSLIHVFPLATFTLGATATWGGATAAGEKYLDIANEGTVTTSGAGGVATLNADYWTSGKTVVGGGWIVDLLGLGEQNAGSFQLNRGTVKMSSPGRPLGIRGGELVGSGTVQGSLVLGGGASASAPILSPWSIGDMPSGLISVIGNFQIFSGKVQVGIGGPGADRTDRVEVTGYAALSGGTAVGLLRADYRFRGPRDRAVFLKANPVLTDFTGPTPPPAWKYDSTAAECWFEPLTGQIKGKASRDDNQNGVFEPWLGEMSLPGVGVALLDEDGVELDRTVTDGGGSYDFGEHIYGNYQVRFDRPADLRPSPQHAGYNSYSDSDYDVGTLIAAVTLDETHPTTAPNADALFRPLTAADDYYATPFRTPVSGNVLDNDPPPAGAGDALAVALGTGPAGGTVVLNPDGSFTYTPDDDFRGTDTFTYVVSDGYGLTATATVTIVVAPPPPAYVTGRVWDDGWIYYHTPYDLDGLQHTEWMDPGRSVTVALLDADGQIVATTTSEGMYGFYSFEVAVAGSYRVRFSLPDVPGMEFHFTLPNAGDDAIDSDADEWGETDLFVIDYGETVTRDAGVYWVYGDTFP